MKKTLILTISTDAKTRTKRRKDYRTILTLVKRAVMRTENKTQARVCLGNFKFLSEENVALQRSPLIHIIVTGKNLDAFYDSFIKQLDNFPFMEIRAEFRANGNAFNRANNRFFNNISLEEALLKTNGKARITLSEKVTASFFLLDITDA